MHRRVNGITLNVEERGGSASSRPALVFLHYFGGSSRAWRPVIECLPKIFRCVAPDLRGFGESEAPPSGYAAADGADDVAALIGAMGLEHYILVGHSMGGKIALTLAARQPVGLASLVLLAPSPPTPEPMEDTVRERLLRGHADRAEAEATVHKITARPLPVPLFEQAVEDSLRSSPPSWDAWLRHGSREDLSAQMPRVVVPVLVASGTSDPVVPASLLQREVLARLLDGHMTMLPGVGHLSPLEAPAVVADLIERALMGTVAVVPLPRQELR
jgi:pimeloyl-ACP methyl ester carboxylesterase